MNAGAVRIGELAADLDLNPKTIRYYESIGLLPAPERTPSGYRQYRGADRDRLRFIVRARSIGLTLKETGEVLSLRAGGERPCAHVLEILDHKLRAVDAQLQALTDFRRELVALQQNAVPSAPVDACVCGIIETYQPSHGAASPGRPDLSSALSMRC